MTDNIDPLGTYRFLRDRMKTKPDLSLAKAFMDVATRAWADGRIGEATYVREALEPVRSYLLAGNTPRRDGKPERSPGFIHPEETVLQMEASDERAALAQAVLSLGDQHALRAQDDFERIFGSGPVKAVR